MVSDIVKLGTHDEANLVVERGYNGHSLYASIFTDVAEVKIAIMRDASPSDLTKLALELIKFAMKVDDPSKIRDRVVRELTTGRLGKNSMRKAKERRK